MIKRMCRTCRRAVAVLLLLVVGVVARADAPRDLIKQGNEHYAAGRYAEALEAYDGVAADAAAQSPELLHNRAAAHFKLGQLEEARDLWVRLKASADPALEARGSYNLGNCDYAEALAGAQEDPQRAMELLGQAGEQYRAALELDPSLDDARANLELAYRLKQQIEEQLQQQQQSQPSSDQSQQDQQQQDQQQQSTQPSESQDEQQSDQQQNDSSQNSQPESQPSESQQSPSEEQEDQQQQQQGEEEEQQEGEQQQEEEQQQDQEGQQQNQPESMPAEEPPSASEQERENLPPIEMAREQAERLLQMIRDAEKARREKLARQQAAGQKPVERDW